MTLRLWQSDTEVAGAELNLVVVIASTHLLYAILEGPPLPVNVPRFPGDPEWKPHGILYVHVITASGVELTSHAGGSYGGGGGPTGLEPRSMVLCTVAPPDEADLSKPLRVRLLREDLSIIWEVTATPALQPH
jgi:hypothetical protein